MSENPTFNQINEQESSAYMNRSGAKPTVLIERSDGRITVGNLDRGTQNVLFTEKGADKMHPNVSLERLTDAHQEMLAAKLAGVALLGSETHVANESDTLVDQEAERLGAEIAVVDARIEELKASMQESDRVPAWQFAVARFKNETDSALARLSEQGKRQAETYQKLYVQLKALREQQASV